MLAAISSGCVANVVECKEKDQLGTQLPLIVGTHNPLAWLVSSRPTRVMVVVEQRQQLESNKWPRHKCKVWPSNERASERARERNRLARCRISK